MQTTKPILAALACAFALAGCAGMVSYNDGDRVVIEHDSWVGADQAREQATRACAQSGKPGAAWVRTANKNPSFSAGTGVQLSTYRCE